MLSKKHPRLLSVLRLVRQEAGERKIPKSVFQRTPSKGFAPNLRQAGDPHSEGRLYQTSVENSPIQPEPSHPSTRPTPQLPTHRAQGGRHHPESQDHGQARRADKTEAQNVPGPREKGVLIPAPHPHLPWRACRLESKKMVFTTRLATINYSRPRFPQTHRLSLLAR